MTTDALDVATAAVETTVETTNKFVLVYMRTLLERGMAAFTTGGSDPLSVVDVTLGNHRNVGHSPLGWAYIYTGDPSSSKIGDPSCHSVIKWHVQRFSGDRGGIIPSHLFKQECCECGYTRFLTLDAWNDIYELEVETKQFLRTCPKCNRAGVDSTLVVYPDEPQLNQTDVALRKYIVSSMKKQDINWAPLLPRVYGLYTGKAAKLVDKNIETSSWGPGDNDEAWFTRVLKQQYNRTAVVRPYSLCKSLMRPERWLMLLRETTCGWVPSYDITPIESIGQVLNGYIRGWAIDLVTPR